MKSKARKYLFGLIGFGLLLAVWEICAVAINFDFILPTVEATFIEFVMLFTEGSFYLTVLSSLGRILLGLVLGILLGIALALFTNYIPYTREILSPLITVIRSTPVASFIMVLWLIVGSDFVPTVIAVLMVMPIIWQNLETGFSSVAKDLNEVCQIYGIKGKRKLRILIYPTLKEYLIPSIITSAGLSWKSGIAAEIISYTANSIGREIYLAKAYFESGKLFAWTLIVVISSLIIEKLLKYLSQRGKHI